MKRMLLALTLVVGLFVFPSSASATHDLLGFQSAVDAMLAVDPTLDPPPNDGTRDFVVGGFHAFGNTLWGLSAHSGPLGEAPFGHVSQTQQQISGETKHARWRVTCLDVDGDLAAATGIPTEARSNDDFGPHVFVFRDGGPGRDLDGVEQRGLGAGRNPVNLHHPLFDLAAALAPPNERGNILVHDAMP